jgi:hypothetical protein
MIWIFGILFDAYSAIIDELCAKRPWWIWALWTLGPFVLLGLIIGALLLSP